MSRTLARRQEWLFTAITAPTAPAAIARVLGGTAVPPDIGLEVYRHGYRARLRECLVDDFTAVERVLGAEAFAALADRYITDEPPRDATLNAYGSRFPEWLQDISGRLPRRGHLVELARLEWALVEAIHAPLAPPIAPAALAAVAPDAWGAVVLTPAPSLRVIPCAWNANATYEAFRGGVPLPPAERRPGAVAVMRRSAGLRRIDLARDEGRLLARLAAGVSLGRALAGIPAQRSAAVQAAFATWLADGLFTALRAG